MISIEVAAKTVQKAIEEGLLKLNKTIDEVDISIISSGGLFKKAKVTITVLEDEKPVREVKKEQIPQEKREQAKPAPAFKQDNKPAQKPFEQKQKPEQKQDCTEKKPFEQKQDAPSKKFEQRPPRENQEKSAPALKPDNNPEQKPFQRQEKQDFRQNNVRNNEYREDRPRQRQDFKQNREEKIGDGNEKADERQQRPKADITEEAAKQAYEFVDKLLKKMDIDFALTSKIVDGDLKLSVECDSGAVIGYRGETLDSIEYLASLSVNKCDDKYYRVSIDCNDYRSKRVETLSGLANRMADKAVKTGRKVVLEPMSSSSRKIIHSVLSANDRIITKSEGREPNRRIVIIPKRYRQVNDNK